MNQMIRQSHRLLRLARPTRSMHTSASLLAAPEYYVSGVTPDQIASNPALAEYYRANFGSWESDPDVFIKQAEVQPIEVEEISTDEHAPIVPPQYNARGIRPLVAYARLPGKEEGSRNCHKMRNPYQTNLPNIDYFPLIPGIVRGSDPTQNIISVDPTSKILIKTPWFEIQRELDRYHHSFQCRVYALTIYSDQDCHVSYHKSKQNVPPPQWNVCQDSMTITEIPPPPPPILPKRTPLVENMLVIPTDLQMHPVDHMAFCLNFLRYHPSKPIKLPIRTINEEESPAMKRGGFLAFANKTIECLIDVDAVIPEFIPLECTGLRQKDVVRRDRLVLPEGVTIHPRVGEDYLVGSVFGAKGGGAVVVEEEDEKKKKK
ncbi:hypothetical protein ACHAXN_005770 [Cyclotella atomus]